MRLRREAFFLILGIVSLAFLASVLASSMGYDSPLDLAVRLFALYGYLTLGVACVITPFLREITRVFGRPFIKVHHAFAAMGIAFSTAHPVAYAVKKADLSVFLPSFESWYLFWSLAGRPALIILYIAAAAALLRRRNPVYWRPVHALMYVVLFFGVVHANLIGTDFQNAAIQGIFAALFAGSIMTFSVKRLQQNQLAQRRKRIGSHET